MSIFHRNINSACLIENDIYKSAEYDSDLESEENIDFAAAGDNDDFMDYEYICDEPDKVKFEKCTIETPERPPSTNFKSL